MCDDGWDKMDADVVCRQLGYPEAVKAVGSQTFNTQVEVGMPILFSEVQCHGAEKKIDDCAKTVVNATSSEACTHEEDAGVVCKYAHVCCVCMSVVCSVHMCTCIYILYEVLCVSMYTCVCEWKMFGLIVLLHVCIVT